MGPSFSSSFSVSGSRGWSLWREWRDLVKVEMGLKGLWSWGLRGGREDEGGEIEGELM